MKNGSQMNTSDTACAHGPLQAPVSEKTREAAGRLRLLGATVFEGEPMGRRVYYGVGGPADMFIILHDPATVPMAMETLVSMDIPWYPIGDGTNLLILDEGFGGALIMLGREFDYLDEEPCKDGKILLRAGAAVAKPRLVEHCCRRNLEGMTFLAGVPGQVGGGIAMNAGTKYGWMSDVLEAVTYASPGRGMVTIGREELFGSYRHSLVPAGSIVVEAVFGVTESPDEGPREKVREILEERAEKQPLHLPSCGSTFKNPQGHSAGRLIEACGLKGRACGGAHISDKHANFILNSGGSRAGDILSLIELAKAEVLAKFGITLEEEVVIIGRNGPRAKGH